ncbi:restriction endonuclease subunit S [Methylobacterium sp. P1-11]|uniref:restriction endonuclease subunit S n=1 Tax=Methylobacterium sp. P1-11 TaxID=2024616 RepID=UPI0011EF85EC|nr:restriction endonuclease subunit S [Methylobacterium sp. P1-11]KAA0124281.1 restriction endonuclease subunit S [Methylobacterium sp. P1-11]
MSAWRTHRIGELGRIVTGKTPPASLPEMFCGTVPFLTPTDMKDDCRHVVTGRAVSTAWDPKSRALLPAQTICVVCIGATIGKICMTTEPTHTNQQVNSIIVDTTRFDPYFIYYAMRLKASELKSRAAGAATPIINKTAFSSVTIESPDLPTQKRIASFLTAYDDLIEVNRQRLTLLKDMSHGLFEEIVRRAQIEAPGNYVAMTDLVASTLGGDWGTDEPDEENNHQVRVIRGTDLRRISDGDFSSCPTRYISASSALKRTLRPHDVVLENSINARTRAAGTTHFCTQGMLDRLGGSVIAASFCRVFRFRLPEEAAVFHLELQRMHHSGEIEKFQVVAANGIANFQTTPFLRDARARLSIEENRNAIKKVLPLLDTRFAEQIGMLTASRNHLLPRLISGQLSVAAAERELLEAA